MSLLEKLWRGLLVSTLLPSQLICECSKDRGYSSEHMNQRKEKRWCSSGESTASAYLFPISTSLYMGSMSRRLCRKAQKIGKKKEDLSYYSFPEGAQPFKHSSWVQNQECKLAVVNPVCHDHCVSLFPLWKMRCTEM